MTRSAPDESPAAGAPNAGRYALGVGYRVTVVGIGVNLALIAAKLAAGILGHSQALIADGVHSISDFFTDAVVLFGLKAGRRDPDEDHPFGHGRIETLASFIIGLALMGVAVGIAVDAVGNVRSNETQQPSWVALIAAGLSIVSKEILYHYTVRTGRLVKSSAIIANAWHHRSDAMSSVAVFAGVGAAQINPEWSFLDAWAALLVSVLVAKVGWDILWSSVKEFTDTAPNKQIIERMRRIAGNTDGILDVHDIKVRTTGGQYLMEMHVVVDGEITVTAGHAIAKRAKSNLKIEFEDLASVIIHVDPSR